MNKLEETLAQIAKLLADTAQQHGPAAGTVLLEAARAQCIQNVLVGTITLLIVIACAISMRKVYAASNKYEEEYKKSHPHQEPDAAGYVAGFCILGGLGLISSILTLAFLTQVVTWIGLFRPEVYIASKILRKLISD